MNLWEVVNRGEWRRSVDHDVIGRGHSMFVNPGKDYGRVMDDCSFGFGLDKGGCRR